MTSIRNRDQLRYLGLACLIFISSVNSFSILPSSTRSSINAFPSRPVTTSLQARGRKQLQPRQKEVKPPMNGEIEASELRVVTASASGGKDDALGIMSKEDALAKAKEMGGLDLILINNNSDPPVCKIAEYTKFRYEKQKKAKEAKKNSKASETKEVKMSYKIDVHDYGVRKKNAAKFLSQGNRVKCTVMFRGREAQHDKLGFELLEKLIVDLGPIAVRDGKAKKEGPFRLSCILSPSQDVLRAVSKDKRTQEKEKKKKKEQAYKEKQDALSKVEKEQTIAATTVVAETEEEKLINGLNFGEDDDDEDVESSLDALLGSDDLTDDLFA